MSINRSTDFGFSEVYKLVEDNVRGETIRPKAIKSFSPNTFFSYTRKFPIQLLNMYFFISTKPILIISCTRFEKNILQLPWKIWTEKQTRAIPDFNNIT